jgi:hypothetical protein
MNPRIDCIHAGQGDKPSQVICAINACRPLSHVGYCKRCPYHDATGEKNFQRLSTVWEIPGTYNPMSSSDSPHNPGCCGS